MIDLTIKRQRNLALTLGSVQRKYPVLQTQRNPLRANKDNRILFVNAKLSLPISSRQLHSNFT